MKHKKSLLFPGVALVGIIGGLGTFSHASNERKQPEELRPLKELQRRQTKFVSGEIIHIDEDSYAVWGRGAGSNAHFDNLRIKGNDGLVHKLIYLGPSSYKVGDKVNKLDYKWLEEGGISIQDLNDLLTSIYTSCQTGYVEADGIVNPKY